MSVMPATLSLCGLDVHWVQGRFIHKSIFVIEPDSRFSREGRNFQIRKSMRNRIFFIAFGILICIFVFTARETTSAQKAAPKPHEAPAASAPAATPTKADCLGCHGPFEKLIESSGNYAAPSGEKISPHRYVPHDSKKEERHPRMHQVPRGASARSFARAWLGRSI